jgi:hypothetical protein
MREGGILDIREGTLICSTAQEATLMSYISNGWITAYGGAGTVETSVSGTRITVTAIPEPATAGLFVVSSAGLIILRRHNKNS